MKQKKKAAKHFVFILKQIVFPLKHFSASDKQKMTNFHQFQCQS